MCVCARVYSSAKVGAHCSTLRQTCFPTNVLSSFLPPDRYSSDFSSFVCRRGKHTHTHTHAHTHTDTHSDTLRLGGSRTLFLSCLRRTPQSLKERKKQRSRLRQRCPFRCLDTHQSDRRLFSSASVLLIAQSLIVLLS